MSSTRTSSRLFSSILLTFYRQVDNFLTKPRLTSDIRLVAESAIFFSPQIGRSFTFFADNFLNLANNPRQLALVLGAAGTHKNLKNMFNQKRYYSVHTDANLSHLRTEFVFCFSLRNVPQSKRPKSLWGAQKFENLRFSTLDYRQSVIQIFPFHSNCESLFSSKISSCTWRRRRAHSERSR